MSWINVKDRLPEGGETVLVATNGWPNNWNTPEILMGEYFTGKGSNGRDANWRVVDLWGEYHEPYQFLDDEVIKWWQPLPDPPKEG